MSRMRVAEEIMKVEVHNLLFQLGFKQEVAL
jgi:hypothetical protein